MQSDDLFVRKFRRQSPRPPLAAVTFDAMRERGVPEWPPRRPGEDDGTESLTPSRAGLKLRSVGRSHIMQRSNSDVTLGDADSSGKGLGNAAWAGGQRVGLGGKAGTGDSGVALRREYGSLSSLEKQMQPQAPISEDQAPLSPAAQRFTDPFLLLGLPAEDPNPDMYFRTLSMPAGDSPKLARLPKLEMPNKKAKLNHAQPSQPGPCDGVWVRNLAHYDAAQPASPSQAGTRGGRAKEPEQAPPLLDEGDGNDTDMLLSCPHFRNETGGEERPGLGQTRGPGGVLLSLQSPNDAVSVLEEPRESKQQGKSNYHIEFADLGAQYYRKYFYRKEHQNFFGIDDRFGPLAVSFRREEKEGCSGAQYNYRIIFRTTELRTLRGSLLEESVPSAARHTNPRGISPKKLLEFIMPELNLHCLRLASTSPKVRDTLLKLDEQGLNFQRKVGVMYCRAGQSSEEDMYNNESAGPAFDEFLDLLGERVRLLAFDRYRAQLDNKTDSTGTHSLYTRYQDYEIMFHVSTMLPYTANNTQQLLRKRHIGNDIVTIVFQEPGALPFTPKVIRSHFQHVFIVVQVHHPCTDHTYYRVAVTRSMDIPLFGPLFPKGARFPAPRPSGTSCWPRW
ncbi:hypothetical protein MATL_G00053450 [Megalops atlanticus]|uniref:Rap-GAP domain-containing protein n=1 Tax=Megalops atlanticus TaxID=7932 RepID=A0A9D3QED5_MEGAT|nr:hypothetical protein MATL_G00053450 [Megalops atlanticus]